MNRLSARKLSDLYIMRNAILSRHPILLAAAIAAGTAAGSVQASGLDSLELLSQDNFETLSENLSAALHYRGITPTEPLGVIGFDVGVSLTATEIDDEILDLASDGDFDLDQIFIPRLNVHKGLPFGFDIGGFISAVPETDITLLGLEVRKAIFEGSTVTPAIGIRLGATSLQGLDQLDLQSLLVDISISKGVLFFTPYAGLGYVLTRAEASSEFDLDDETVTQQKAYIGLNINFGLNFTVELDRTDDFNSFSAKAGIRF